MCTDLAVQVVVGAIRPSVLQTGIQELDRDEELLLAVKNQTQAVLKHSGP